MPARASFDYAVIRVVPRVDRGEFINAGVILFCRTRRFLAAQIELDHGRLLALAPAIHIVDVEQHLDAIPRICAGSSGSGPIGRLPLAERFHWLVAPRSAMIQTGPVHSGLCVEAAPTLERLLHDLVRTPRAGNGRS